MDGAEAIEEQSVSWRTEDQLVVITGAHVRATTFNVIQHHVDIAYRCWNVLSVPVLVELLIRCPCDDTGNSSDSSWPYHGNESWPYHGNDVPYSIVVDFSALVHKKSS